ncbi:MAG TPA: recombinase family protein [bacterium]|nr:recombinase family protein [bacterium]
MKKIIAYCRVSTDNQKEEGTIELQVEAIKDYCKSRDLELVEIFKDEGISGGLENRPALADLFSFLEEVKDIDAVVIFKLDRLARDLYIQEHIIKKLEALNVGLISTKEPNLASDDPMRKAFRQFMGIVAELEKSFITMRLSGGRINKAKKGRYAGGGVAIGYKSEGKELVISGEEAEIVKKIYKLRRSRKGLREIARTLNENNIPTARGGKWYAGTVKYILENPIYKGVLEYSTVECKRPDLVLVTR